MATTVGSPVFVDTNVLVYTSLPTSPMQAVAEQALNALAGSGVELWISRQVLRE
jgi:predicted nucleic-acid-binding protein